MTTGKAVESITARADALAGRQLATIAPLGDRHAQHLLSRRRRSVHQPAGASLAPAPPCSCRGPTVAERRRTGTHLVRRATRAESSTVAATAYAQVGPRARVVEVDDLGNASSGTCMARSPQPPRATATQSSQGQHSARST